MPFAVFLRSVKLDMGESNGVHLGFLEYEKDQVVELSETSYARWMARNAAAPAPAPAPAPEVKAAPAAKPAPATKLPAAADATASEASADAAATAAPLPPFGAPAKK